MAYSSNSDHGIEELDFANAGNCTQDSETIERSAAAEVIMPSKPAVYGFHYAGVTAAVAEEAEATAERIRNRHRASIIDTGNDLNGIKGKLAHGQFGNWLNYHFGMSERTAQNYMNAAAAFGLAPKVIDLLPPTTIYKLAAKGAPEQIRQSVIEGVAKGLPLNQKEIDSRIAAAQKEERQKREAERAAKQKQRDWQKHEQALRASGKTETDIEKERKRWEKKKAREDRHADQKAPEAKQREEAALQREEGTKTAAHAAQILKARLGNDYETFRDVLVQIDYQAFKVALLSA